MIYLYVLVCVVTFIISVIEETYDNDKVSPKRILAYLIISVIPVANLCLLGISIAKLSIAIIINEFFGIK